MATSDGASDVTTRATRTSIESRSKSPEEFAGADGDVGPLTVAGAAGIESRSHSVGDEHLFPRQISSSTIIHGDNDAGAQGNFSDDGASVVTVRRLDGGGKGISMVSISDKLRGHENEDAMSLRQQSWLEIVRGRILRHGIESVNDDPLAPEEEVGETAQDGPLPLRNEGDRYSRND